MLWRTKTWPSLWRKSKIDSINYFFRPNSKCIISIHQLPPPN